MRAEYLAITPRFAMRRRRFGVMSAAAESRRFHAR